MARLTGGTNAWRVPSGKIEVVHRLAPIAARTRSEPKLAATIEAAGPALVTTIRGERRALLADVDLTAYRIVQEALTNVTRHANAGTATVLLDYLEAALEIRVDDDGRGATRWSPRPGNGLLGMRERAAAIGGVLEAGPHAGGGFRVYARLPRGGAR